MRWSEHSARFVDNQLFKPEGERKRQLAHSMLIDSCNKGVEMVEFRRTEDAAGLGDAAAAAWLRDAQVWTGLQCELLSGIEALWAEYARRQSEAVEVSARTWQGLFDGRHFIEIAQLQRNWLASAARRTADAADRWAGDSAARTRAASSAAGSVAEAAEDSTRQPTNIGGRAPHERKEHEREAAE